MTRRPALRDHVATMIMESAASVLAERGDAVSMADIAKAADVGRATLYRYFPSRDTLIAAMAEAALEDLSARMEEAGLESVPVREAIARIARAFIANGQYAALERGARVECVSPIEIDRRLTTPLRELFQRGIDTGAFRTDMSADTIVAISGALLHVGIALAVTLGAEQASATITSLFLDGVSAPSD